MELSMDSPAKYGDTSSKCSQRKKLSGMLGPKWNKQELQKFYEAFRDHEKDWKKVAAAVHNRTVEMVESLYSMNRAYLSLPESMASLAGFIAKMTDHYSNLMPITDVQINSSGIAIPKNEKKLSNMLGPKWNKEELQKFYKAFRDHEKDWKKVAAAIHNRTVEMVESLYTMNRAYLSLPEGTASVVGFVAMMTDHYSNLMPIIDVQINSSGIEIPKNEMKFPKLLEIKLVRICNLSSLGTEQVSKQSSVSFVAQFIGGDRPLLFQLCEQTASLETKSRIVDLPSTQLFKLSSVKSLCIESEASEVDPEEHSRKWIIEFETNEDRLTFHQTFREWKRGAMATAPEINAVENHKYFDYYGQLETQQHMLEDYAWTVPYKRAIKNFEGFKGSVVIDVGAGSGILSLFAAQAGAKKVYAVEASEIVKYTNKLIEKNSRSGARIEVIHGKMEDVTLPEKVDILISEPLGLLLVHERMLETYLKARDMFLKPGGKMFPKSAVIYVAPYHDDHVYDQITKKANFWTRKDHFGVDLSDLHLDALEYYLSRPLVTMCKKDAVLAQPCSCKLDFQSLKVEELHSLKIPFKFAFQDIPVDKSGNPRNIQGFVFWFDAKLPGRENLPRGSSVQGPDRRKATGNRSYFFSKLRLLLLQVWKSVVLLT